MRALILDGDQKSALSALRALSARGIQTSVGASRSSALALHSRHADTTFVYTHPLLSKERFVRDVLSFCTREKEPPVLFAFSDATFLSLARAYSDIQKCARMVLPSSESVEIAFDKARTMDLAQKLAIPIPPTFFPTTSEDARTITRKVSFPVVVKPRHSASWLGDGGVSGSVVFVQTIGELEEVFTQVYEETGEPPLIETYIEGDEYGIEVFAHEGEVAQWFAHKRIRSLSPTGGASVVKESIELPPDLKEYSTKLVRELSWSGVAMLEFKRDKKQGDAPLLLEINGRFWGSLPLALSAGVDFPFQYFSYASGERDITVASYATGIVTRYLLGDVKHLLTTLFKRGSLPSAPQQSRLRSVYDFIRAFRYKEDVFHPQDPKPFFAEILDRLL